MSKLNESLVGFYERVLSIDGLTIADLYYAKQAMDMAETAKEQREKSVKEDPKFDGNWTFADEVRVQQDANLDDPKDFIIDEYSRIVAAGITLGLTTEEELTK